VFRKNETRYVNELDVSFVKVVVTAILVRLVLLVPTVLARTHYNSGTEECEFLIFVRL
jgi:hypothetical protein